MAKAIERDIKGAELFYIGSRGGLESELVPRAGIRFESVSVGKFRRYFSIANFIDLFRIPFGVFSAWVKIGRIKPDLVFSKGGFVSFPVVVAARLRGVPVLTHESDAILGLATRLIAPFADKVLLGWDLPLGKKYMYVGNPVREEILKGHARGALSICGFDGTRPVLFVMGGSTGSKALNDIVSKEKNGLLKHYDIVHITGDGKGRLKREKHYYSTPYMHEEIKDFFALASLALSRAGANALAELETLQIPTLLYPLGLEGSRGDQIANARALAARSKLFLIANSKKSALEQLLKLPKRPSGHKENLALEKIVGIIKSL